MSRALGPEHAWIERVEEPELRRIIERICRTPVRAERDIPGPKGPGPVVVDAYHPRRAEPAPPRRGGRLVHRINDEPRVLHSFIDGSAIASEIADHVYEGLLDLDEETWELTPLLAERYSVDDIVITGDGARVVGTIEDPDADPLVLTDETGERRSWPRAELREVLRGCAFTFWLREDARFHDGEPCDADDVLFSWRLLTTPEVPIPTIQSYYEDMESFEKLDRHTVRAYWSKPYWRALDVTAGWMRVHPLHAWDPEGLLEKDPARYGEIYRTHELASAPIGTGPYRFGSWQRGYEVVLERHDDYYAPDREPRWLDEIRFRVVVDGVSALQALEAGEVDFIDRLSGAEEFEEFRRRSEASGRFVYVETLYPSYYYIGWNLRRPMFQDRRVRWALALGSVDLDRFIDDVYRGKAVRASQDQFRYGRAYHPGLPPLPYEPETAKELLAAAGWWDSDGDNVLDRDGEPFAFELLVRNVPASHPFLQLAERMKENLKRLGVRLSIRSLDWPSLLEAVDKRSFDALQIGWAYSDPPHESDPYQIWHSSQSRERGSNVISYSNPEVDRLIEAARVEVDWERRQPIQRKISELIYRDQGYLFLFTTTMFRLYNARFRGVKMYLPRPGYETSEWYSTAE